MGHDPLVLAHFISCISDIYTVIHSSRKGTVIKQHQNNFVIGGHSTGRTVLKNPSTRKVGKHCTGPVAQPSETWGMVHLFCVCSPGRAPVLS